MTERLVRLGWWSRFLDKLLGGMNECAASRGMRVNRKTLQAWRNPKSLRSLPVADVETLPLEVRRAIVEKLAESLGCVLAELPGHTATSDIRALTSVAKESSELMQALAEGIEDNHLTAAEGVRIEREATDVISAAAAVRERARHVQRERVCGVSV